MSSTVDRETTAFTPRSPDGRHSVPSFNGLVEAADVLKTISDGIVVLSADWRFLYVNEPAEQMLGREAVSLLGRDHWEVFPHIRGTGLEKLYRRVVEHGTPGEAEHFSDASERWYHVKAHPSPLGLTVCFSDVTDRKRVAAAHEVTEERFRLAVSDPWLTLYEQDRDLRYTWLYPLHPEHAHALGRTDYELSQRESLARLITAKQRVLETGIPVRLESSVELRGGRTR